MDCCENKNIIKKRNVFLYKLCYDTWIYMDRI